MFRRSAILAAALLSAAPGAFCQSNPPPAAVPPAGVITPRGPDEQKPPRRPRPRMPRPNRYTGTMLKMDGTNLVLEARQPGGGTTQLIIPTDARTPVWINGARSHLEDLKPGMTISGLHFAATPAGPARFTVNATDPELNGTLIKVDGTNLVVKVSEPGSEPHEVNVSTDQKTRVRYITPAEEGGFSVVADSAKVADLKPGSAIGVFPGHGMAARISVTVATNAPAPGPAGGPPQQ